MAPAILVGLLFVFVLLAIAGNSDSDKASNAASGSSVSAVVDAITPRKSPLKVQVNELAEMIASRAEKGERTIRGGSIIQHYTLDKERFDLPSLIAIHRSAWSEFVELDEFDPTATSRAFNIAAFTLGVQLYQAGMNGAEVSDVVTELTMVGEHPYVKRWLESVPELQAYRRLKLAASELEKREGLTTALGRNDELRYESLISELSRLDEQMTLYEKLNLKSEYNKKVPIYNAKVAEVNAIVALEKILLAIDHETNNCLDPAMLMPTFESVAISSPPSQLSDIGQ